MASANKIIEVSDVKLKTMQVAIHAMTVNGKQMTLSVFRQLPLLISDSSYGSAEGLDDVEEIGRLWGKVEYFWKDNDAALHVVSELEGRLYRNLFQRPNQRDIADANKKVKSTEQELDKFRKGLTGVRNATTTYHKKFYARDGRTTNYYDHAFDEAEIIAYLKYLEETKVDDLAILNQEKANFQRRTLAYDKLSALPQLFIAI